MPRKTKKTSKSLDPERLVLSKQDIIDFCDRVLEKWNKDPSSYSKHIFAMNAVKTSVYFTDEDSLKEIWNEILKWAYELLYENAIAQGKEENVDWSQIMDKIKK